MTLDDLGKVLYSNETICLWSSGNVLYRGEFSAIPTVILHYPVNLLKPVNSMLYIYLE